jgi:hypothetical protein
VLELNKFVVSKCEQFIGKGYVCKCLFRFSVSDFCNKSVNNICDGINESDTSVWHSRLCHLNFGSVSTVQLEFNTEFAHRQRFEVPKLCAIQAASKAS